MRSEQRERRDRMVEIQLARRGIRDRAIMLAMRKVPREQFVPLPLAQYSYDDTPLPIGGNQTISQPYMVALMADALSLEPSDKVLEIGTGSGYATAVLAEIAAEVFTIERHAALHAAARVRLQALGYRNVTARSGDGTKGWLAEAPFDAIVVSASGPRVPRSLRQQLAVGGKLVMPVGDAGLQRLLRVWRTGESRFEEEDLGLVRFMPLIGEEGWPGGSVERPPNEILHAGSAAPHRADG
jgi:protein-L-isoaspartate(D-aspartate) O-methyltransferase